MSKFIKFQLLLFVVLITAGSFFGGMYLGKRGYEVELRKNPPAVEIHNKYPGDKEVDFGQFWDVWDILNKDYLERPIDPNTLVEGAIKGMVESLDDPYTAYLPRDLNEAVNNDLNGTYQGIGAELGIRDNRLIIVSPLEGSPAQKAGVRPGDTILEIEGKSTLGSTVTEAVAVIRGPAGSTSTLTLQRGDSAPFEVKIKRDNITVKSVTWEDKGEGTGYIRINRFGGETNKDWADAVSNLNANMAELDAIILDLRGNPGGYLQSAVYISEEFFNDKVVLYQENALGEQTPARANRLGAFQNVPNIIVMIDGGSASASEILAGALKAQRNATLIGTKSFGKGTIQDAKDFKNGAGIHITIAKWLTPDKVWVHNNGIEPDITVEFDMEKAAEEQDIQQDSQLDAAIEYANRF